MVQSATRIFAASLLGGLLWMQVASAQEAKPDPALVDKAKQEGTVSLYGIMPSHIAQKFAERFQAAYGIKTEIFRAGGAQIQQKLALEIRTGRVTADVIEIGDPAGIDRLAAKGDMADFVPAASAGMRQEMLGGKGAWTTIGQSVFPLIYNKQLVKAEEAPQRYKDLADPRWKDKVALASPNYGSTQLSFIKGLIELEGWDLVDSLKKSNAMVAQGWPDAENLIVTGERLVGPDIVSRLIEAQGRGAPLGFVFPKDAVIAAQDVMAIMKKAPHPNAARLLVEFYLAAPQQQFLAENGFYPVRAEAGAPAGMPKLAELNLHYIDIKGLEDQHAAIVQRWTDTLER